MSHEGLVFKPNQKWKMTMDKDFRGMLGIKRLSDRDYSYLCHSQQTRSLYNDQQPRKVIMTKKKYNPYDKQSMVQISKHCLTANNLAKL